MVLLHLRALLEYVEALPFTMLSWFILSLLGRSWTFLAWPCRGWPVTSHSLMATLAAGSGARDRED